MLTKDEICIEKWVPPGEFFLVGLATLMGTSRFILVGLATLTGSSRFIQVVLAAP